MKKYVYICSFIFCVLCFSIALNGATVEKEKPFKRLEQVRILPAEDEEDVYFKSPPVIEADDKGNLYAFDPNNHHFVYKISPAGKLLKTISRKGRGPGDLYRPRKMRIVGDRLFILDEFAVSIFGLEGRFISRFRPQKHVQLFDVGNGRIFVTHEGTDKLITVYDFKGKELFSFGKKYTYDASLFPGHGDSIDSFINDGHIVCCDKVVLFVSRLFGEAFKYDSEGKFISMQTFADFSEANKKIIQKNRKTFYREGVKDGENLQYTGIYADILHFKGKLYMMHGGKRDYEELVILDLKTMRVIEKYRLYFANKTESKEPWFSIGKIRLREIDGKPTLYTSVIEIDERDMWINVYR